MIVNLYENIMKAAQVGSAWVAKLAKLANSRNIVRLSE